MKLTNEMGCVGAAILLLLASAWIPFIGPFFSLLTPLPFLYYSTKSGLNQGLKIVAITLLAMGLITKILGYPQTVFFGLELGLLGLIISEMYRRKFTLGFTILGGTSLMLLLGAAILFFIGLSMRMGPLELILSYFQNNLTETIKAYEKMGMDQEKVLQLQEFSKALTNIIIKIYPSIVIIGTGCVVWVNVIVSRPLFRMGSLKYPDFGPMDQWQAPEFMVWGVIAAGFSLFLPSSGIKLLGINSLIVMSIIYAFHGLSIVIFFLNKYTVPRWIRFGIYFLIFFQQIFLLVLAIAGFFDQWIDFRKIHKTA